MTTERMITNALELLEDIGSQLMKLEPKTPSDRDYKMSSLNVRLRLRGNKEILLDTSLAMAIYYIAGDTYWDEESNWSKAEVAEVYVA